jgi:asparagine synthase (glutamine-hydrolysing)
VLSVGFADGQSASHIIGGRLAGKVQRAAELGLPGDCTDTTVIKAAWKRWGVDAPNYLGGVVAFCVSDPSTRSVIIVRDPLGEIPCYYARLGDDLVVSSSLDELLAVEGVSADIDLEAVALRLAGCAQETLRRTDYYAIKKVAPGTLLRVSPTSVAEIRYWKPEDTPLDDTTEFNDAVDRGCHLLWQALTDRLPAVGTVQGAVATHLSAGMDSATVAAYAADLMRSRGRTLVQAYSWAPDPSAAGYGHAHQDERRQIHSAADALGIPVHFSNPARLRSQLLNGVNLLHDPPRAWLMERFHAAHAAATGVTIIVTGWGGDEAISTHGRLVAGELVAAGRLPTAWSVCEPATGRHRRRVAQTRVFARALLQHTTASLRHPPAHITGSDAAWRSYSPDIADARIDHASRWSAGRTTRQQMLSRITLGHLTLRNESWALGGGRVGIRYTSPLQDRRLVEFALSLPPEFFNNHGVNRRIFRAIAARRAPAGVANRRKTGHVEPATQILNKELAHLYREGGIRFGLEQGWPPALLNAWATRFHQLPPATSIRKR